MRIGIVILNWNRKEDTLQCLESIGKLQITNYKLQTIVVDNGSTDGSASYIKKQKLNIKNLKIVENRENLGFAGGNNVGIQHALQDGADFVMVLNNDTVVSKDVLVQLIEVAKSHKDAGILSPKIYFSPGLEFHKDRYIENDLGKVIWYAGGVIDWNNVLGSNRGVDEVDRGQYDKIQETDFATGACMLIRREVLENVGLFDKRYFMYLEDVDLCLRAKEDGWKILYAPLAHLWHEVARSSGIGSELNDYYIIRNRLLFGMRHAPLGAKLALIKEAWKFILIGRKWQRLGAIDFFLGRYGKGSFKI